MIGFNTEDIMSINYKKVAQELAKKLNPEEVRNVVNTVESTSAATPKTALEKWELFTRNFNPEKVASESDDRAFQVQKLAAEAQKELDIIKIAEVASDLVVYKLAQIDAALAAEGQQEAQKQAAEYAPVLDTLLS